MKYFLPILLTLFFGVPLHAQPPISILLVDDSKDEFDNTIPIMDALTAAGHTFDLVDSPNTASGPTAADMAMYDLVIWHTSTDGFALDLWARQDVDNPELVAYLSGGGNLWLFGNDFMFDRYGAPLDDFSAGDFVYDYLGIAQYTAQAYGDDGGLGVPAVAPAEGQPISGLEGITWQFSTLWWADVLTPREEAVPIYLMSGEGYVFDDSPTGLWYDNGTSKCLTFGFDLALAGSQEMINQTVASVIAFFEAGLPSSQTEVPAALAHARVLPNPVSTHTELVLDVAHTAQVQVEVWDAQGRHIATPAPATRLIPGRHTLSWLPAPGLPNGAYHLRILVDGAVVTRTVVLGR